MEESGSGAQESFHPQQPSMMPQTRPVYGHLPQTYMPFYSPQLYGDSSYHSYPSMYPSSGGPHFATAHGAAMLPTQHNLPPTSLPTVGPGANQANGTNEDVYVLDPRDHSAATSVPESHRGVATSAPIDTTSALEQNAASLFIQHNIDPSLRGEARETAVKESMSTWNNLSSDEKQPYFVASGAPHSGYPNPQGPAWWNWPATPHMQRPFDVVQDVRWPMVSSTAEQFGESKKRRKGGVWSRPSSVNADVSTQATIQHVVELLEAAAQTTSQKDQNGDPLKRPMNAFILFSNDERKKIAMENPGMPNKEVSRLLGSRWNDLDLEKKEEYRVKAKSIREEFAQTHPTYRYMKKPKSLKKLKDLAPDIVLLLQEQLGATGYTPGTQSVGTVWKDMKNLVDEILTGESELSENEKQVLRGLVAVRAGELASVYMRCVMDGDTVDRPVFIEGALGVIRMFQDS